NAVQYDLLKRLAAPHDNFFAVGDDEQSIFTWTGSDPYVLVRFGRDYGIERPIVLDKNCRCSRQIFETARRVLAQNPQLFEKQLSAEQESAYEVGAFAFRDEEEEAHLVRRLLLRAELPLEQLGILRQHPPRGLEESPAVREAAQRGAGVGVRGGRVRIPR